MYFCPSLIQVKMKIAIASDHAGYELKERIKRRFGDSYEFEDLGTHSDVSADYPDFAHPLATKVAGGADPYGVLICGTGNGMAMAANKHAGIRAALCWNPEIAALARQHNDANILVMPARFIPAETAYDVFSVFLTTCFEGGRHQRRIDKINIQK